MEGSLFFWNSYLTMKKEDRQNRIIQLVSNREIETQTELAELLSSEGYKATQATISRDIRELRLEKRPSGSKSFYYYPEARNSEREQNYIREKQYKYIRVLTEGYESIEAAGNMVVIKTSSGMAMAVAAALDALDIEEVVGTIAGDDTIMSATRSESDAWKMIRKIRKMVSEQELS